jgi:hypothetical protein
MCYIIKQLRTVTMSMLVRYCVLDIWIVVLNYNMVAYIGKIRVREFANDIVIHEMGPDTDMYVWTCM